jgi:hypothetical protein
LTPRCQENLTSRALMWIRSSGWVLSSTRPAEGMKYQWVGADCGSASSGSGPDFMDLDTDPTNEEYYLQILISYIKRKKMKEIVSIKKICTFSLKL